VTDILVGEAGEIFHDRLLLAARTVHMIGSKERLPSIGLHGTRYATVRAKHRL
jgi:hypothetical protein